MRRIELLTVGNFDRRLAQRLCAPLAAEFAADCRLLPDSLDPQRAFHPEREQYHSTELLAAMQAMVRPKPSSAPMGKPAATPVNSAANQQSSSRGAWRLLGLASVDLYIPVLTFVFGEAQMHGPCAIVGTHRLRQEAYGLPAAPELLFERTLKEAVHELGHTVGLTHCDDYQCAMAPSHAVEWIDVKSATLCEHCRASVTTLVET